jgi:hypothetical protein
VAAGLVQKNATQPVASFASTTQMTPPANRLSPAGLKVKAYLPPAVKQPKLFYQSPATIRSNIEAVVAGKRHRVGSDVARALAQPTP